MRKKFAIFIVLMSLIIPFATLYSFLRYKLHIHKIEVQSIILKGISSSQTVFLKFSLTESITLLKWEHSKEFEYLHQMYDVVNANVVGDSIVYECFPDTKETGIKKGFSDIAYSLLGNNPKQTEKEKILELFFKNLYFNDIYSYSYFEKAKQSNPDNYFDRVVSYCTTPPSPPPESLFI